MRRVLAIAGSAGVVAIAVATGRDAEQSARIESPVSLCARQPSDGGVCLCGGKRHGAHTACDVSRASGQCERFVCPEAL